MTLSTWITLSGVPTLAKGYLIFGPLAASGRADTATLSGSIRYSGSIATTGRADTASIAGKSISLGTLAATGRNDSAAVSGGLRATGSLLAAGRADAAALTGGSIVSGTLAATVRNDAVTYLTGSYGYVSYLSSWTSLSAVTSMAQGIVTPGSLSASGRADTASLSGGIRATGTLVAAGRDDAAALAGGPIISGALAATVRSDAVTYLTGSYGYVSYLSSWTTLSAVTSMAQGIVTPGSLSASGRADTASLSGGIRATGSLVVAGRDDAAALAGGPIIGGALAATVRGDVATYLTGSFGYVSYLSTWTSLSAVVSMAIGVSAGAVILSVGRDDTASLTGRSISQGELAASCRDDVSALSGGSCVCGGITAAARDDFPYLTGSVGYVSYLSTWTTLEAVCTLAGGVCVIGSILTDGRYDTAILDGNNIVFGRIEAGSVSYLASWTALDIVATMADGIGLAFAGSDVAAITGDAGSTAPCACLESYGRADTAALNGAVKINGVLAPGTRSDQASLSGGKITTGQIAAAGRSDSAAISGEPPNVVLGRFGAWEVRDFPALSGQVKISGSIATTGSRDAIRLYEVGVFPGSADGMPRLLLAGFIDDSQPQAIRSELAEGRPQVRRRFTAGLDWLNVAWHLDAGQVQKFEDFFEYDCGQGATAFYWTHPVSGLAITARFIEPYGIAPLGDDHYLVTASVEILP